MLFKRSENHGFSRYICLLLLLIIFLAFSLFLAVSLGSVTIDIQDTYQIIFSKFGFYLGTGKLSPSTIAIVWNMRVPRVLLGILAGAGLSVCGSVMQSTVNNPIAEPYILGISAGATFGATLSIILGLKSITGAGAFIGAILASAVVLFIASMQGKMTTSSLILSGTVVNALFIAFSNFIISVGANADSLMTIKFWTMGSLAGTSWSDLVLPALFVFLFPVSDFQYYDDGGRSSSDTGSASTFLLVPLYHSCRSHDSGAGCLLRHYRLRRTNHSAHCS